MNNESKDCWNPKNERFPKSDINESASPNLKVISKVTEAIKRNKTINKSVLMMFFFKTYHLMILWMACFIWVQDTR